MMPARHDLLPLHEVAELIHPGTKKQSVNGGARLNIQCIAHDDKNPSLTIWHDSRGKLAMNCHANCPNEAIEAAMPPAALEYARSTWGIDEGKILVFPNHKPQPPVEPEPEYGLEAEYPYVTENGELAYMVRRYKDKKIRQYHKGAAGVLKPGRGPAELIPYRLPDVLAANRAGDTIYIVEGEKDADTLASVGLTATCNVGGAGKWTDQLGGWFAGAHIVILPDNDQPGREHALDVSLKLDGIAETIKIVELPDLPPKGDVTDWLEDNTVQDLLEVIAEAGPDRDEWEPLDLSPILDGDAEHLDPAPSVLWRDDNKIAFLYAGEINWMSGEPESGKSWVAQVAAAQELEKGHQVTYIDFEDTPGRIVQRFRMLGVSDRAIRSLLHYVRPSIASTDAQIARLCSESRSSSLAVIDGTTDLHIIHGLSPEDNKDVATIVQRILRPLADAGPAVFPIDHVTKNKETRGRYAIGGQHKLAAVRGASYGVEVTRPFARGDEGHAYVYIAKDRPGHIRGLHTVGPLPGGRHLAFSFRLWDTETQIRYAIDPPVAPEQAKEMRRVNQVWEAVQDLYNGTSHLTKNDIVNHPKVTGSKADILKTIDEMIDGGMLTNTSETVHARIHPNTQFEWE